MARTKNTHSKYASIASAVGHNPPPATDIVRCLADEREKCVAFEREKYVATYKMESAEDVELVDQLIKSKIEFGDICDELETMKDKFDDDDDDGLNVCEVDFSEFLRLKKQFTASINQFEILHGKVTMMHRLEVEDLRQIIESQRAEIQEEMEISMRYKRVNAVLDETIDIMERNRDNMTNTIDIFKENLIEAQDELSQTTITASLVREELDTLRCISETGKNPLDAKLVCPTSQSPLMPTDIVVIFQGSCSCNVMMKLSASRARIEEFYLNQQVTCIKCSCICDKIIFSTVTEAPANISWSTLEKLTGCGNSKSLSMRNSLVKNVKIESNKTKHKKITKKHTEKKY